ncbi:carbonic anhydrase [Haloterrigena turkmenica DSM 5511]|uniref:carbonic anhydrase n=1 Tax=Haloterrigena turkmenica (strain ATCC 51198 / DSM 5511 / JCM 9101 / NCIMB 13204 / VKM B-1734 / 4k) TaxID=543526 RepID=D2RUC7_HALTV|nr:carbonic anhydrase [Haloterrigena turkmenica]ADB59196.1 carbonic anhydrase [Haloterrigena turkmenica DSM 5511]
MESPRDTLETLLAGNERHVEALPEDYFAEVQTGQHPTVVAICCSDSRVSHEGMWGIDRPGAVFTPSNIGNQIWDEDDGERIVDGGVLYPIHHTGTDVVVVVGHTGCGAVTAAYHVVTGEEPPGPQGVDKWVDQLVPVIEEALESGLIDTDADEERVINQLVEYNVDYQVRSLTEADEIPDDVTVYGFVYDFQGVYGDEPGRTYLVSVDGETDPDALAGLAPEGYEATARSLFHQ